MKQFLPEHLETKREFNVICSKFKESGAFLGAEELQHRYIRRVAPNPEKEQNFAACLCVGRLV